MESKAIGGILLLYDRPEQETAELIESACEKTLLLTRQLWGLSEPDNCQVIIMTSWSGFVFRSAPIIWRILLGVTIPFWVSRIRRTWPLSAGWTQRYGKRVAIGIKPARLLEQADRSVGLEMFVLEQDLNIHIQHVTCHELVHACSAHLRLPMWLNEGIATLTTDRFAGRQMIKESTLDMVREFMPKEGPPSYRQLSRMGWKGIAYHGSRSYWIVRYLEENHPGLIKEQFQRDLRGDEIEQAILQVLGFQRARFWEEVDSILTGHFQQQQVVHD